ncbi:hypothetical protein [Burkholderia cenocepacia]|uniref:hypothetical protein n=1 Tax=Burkholderia cenocepacia TaxID=95486 RepID=UPI0007620829|nr:hypothetical protein [Burkholderia cenocepacia]KWU24776.1 hypothetical protein AS149_32030 [Burkholderia cenocepacia]
MQQAQFKLNIELTCRQVTEGAMRQNGLSPKDMSLKPGTRTHSNRKAEAKRGYAKHRNKHFD